MIKLVKISPIRVDGRNKRFPRPNGRTMSSPTTELIADIQGPNNVAQINAITCSCEAMLGMAMKFPMANNPANMPVNAAAFAGCCLKFIFDFAMLNPLFMVVLFLM